jgi:hypothetical protein
MTAVASGASGVHGVLAIAFGVLLLALVASCALTLVGRSNRVLVDRAVLAAIVAAGSAAIVGLVVYVVAGPPSDALHVVYGAVAVVVIPVVRYAARRAAPRRLSALLGIAALAMLGVLVRLWQTG